MDMKLLLLAVVVLLVLFKDDLFGSQASGRYAPADPGAVQPPVPPVHVVPAAPTHAPTNAYDLIIHGINVGGGVASRYLDRRSSYAQWDPNLIDSLPDYL